MLLISFAFLCKYSNAKVKLEIFQDFIHYCRIKTLVKMSLKITILLLFAFYSMENILVDSKMEGTIVDLSHAYTNDMVYFPGHKHFTLTNAVKGKTPAGYWLEINNLETSEHGGTHMDAPRHFCESCWSLTDIPVDRFMCPAVVVDISHKAAQDPDSQILAADLIAWEEENGRIPDGAIVLLNSNWKSRWSDAIRMIGNDEDDKTNLHFPGFSLEAAKWLTDNRDIYAVGTDTVSLDYGPSRDAAAHVHFLSRNIYGLENVNNLDKLPAKGATVYSFPMKISGGSGGPCRVIAELPPDMVSGSNTTSISVTLLLFTLSFIVIFLK